MKELTKEQIDLLNKPLSDDAITQHPSKSYITPINSIFVTERLNQVFGVGAWQIISEHVHTDVTEKKDKYGNVKLIKMVVCKTTLVVPEYEIKYECFGGNDNEDMGDAYKGAQTDAITKIGSWMGIGAHVWKNDPHAALRVEQEPQKAPETTPKPTTAKRTTKAAPKPQAQQATFTADNGLPFEAVTMANQFNQTGTWAANMWEAIDALTTKEQVVALGNLIDDKWKTKGKINDKIMASKLSAKHKSLTK